MTLAAEVREITSRAEWLGWRRTCITASRIAALFDEHPFLTRLGLAAELRGASQGDNLAMRAGRILEPGVAVALAEDNPDWRIVKATTFHVDPVLRFGATPDYWLDDDGLIQVKTCSPETWEAWHGMPPLACTLQTLAEMMLTGRQRGVLAVMIQSRSYPVFTWDIPRHPEAEQRILDAVASWWKSFDGGEIAEPASVAGLEESLDDGSSVDLSGNNFLCDTLPVREALKAEMSYKQKLINEIDDALKLAMGKASTAYLPGFSISWRSQHRKETILPAKEIRVLRVKGTNL